MKALIQSLSSSLLILFVSSLLVSCQTKTNLHITNNSSHTIKNLILTNNVDNTSKTFQFKLDKLPIGQKAILDTPFTENDSLKIRYVDKEQQCAIIHHQYCKWNSNDNIFIETNGHISAKLGSCETADKLIVWTCEGSLDTYSKNVEAEIIKHWKQPKTSTPKLPTVSYKMNRDGTLSDIVLKESSGNSKLDESAMLAVRSVGPLPPFPYKKLLGKFHISAITQDLSFNMKLPVKKSQDK